MPWYFRRSSHQASLYFSGGISPEKTFQRHWSITRPKGRKAIFSRARFSSRPMSLEASGALSSRPILTRYSGVTESAMVSPTASWKPSLALSRNEGGCLLVGALVEVVAQLVVDGDEVLAGDLDAHLEAEVVDVVDVPGAGVADHVAVARPQEQGALPEGGRAAERSPAR